MTAWNAPIGEDDLQAYVDGRLEPSRADSTKMDDTRFDDYQRLGGGWIAPTVESYSGGKLVQREEYRDIKADPALPDGLFTVGSSAAAPARQ